MTEQAMTTNEQVARALGWLGVGGKWPHATGIPPKSASGEYRAIEDYKHSVDACGELLAWAAERGYRLQEVTVERIPSGEWCSHVEFCQPTNLAYIGDSTADTPTHALAGAICAAWLVLVAKLQEVTA